MGKCKLVRKTAILDHIGRRIMRGCVAQAVKKVRINGVPTALCASCIKWCKIKHRENNPNYRSAWYALSKKSLVRNLQPTL